MTISEISFKKNRLVVQYQLYDATVLHPSKQDHSPNYVPPDTMWGEMQSIYIHYNCYGDTTQDFTLTVNL